MQQFVMYECNFSLYFCGVSYSTFFICNFGFSPFFVIWAMVYQFIFFKKSVLHFTPFVWFLIFIFNLKPLSSPNFGFVLVFLGFEVHSSVIYLIPFQFVDVVAYCCKLPS